MVSCCSSSRGGCTGARVGLRNTVWCACCRWLLNLHRCWPPCMPLVQQPQRRCVHAPAVPCQLSRHPTFLRPSAARREAVPALVAALQCEGDTVAAAAEEALWSLFLR